MRSRPPLAITIVAVVARLAAALYLGNTVAHNPGVYDQISYHNLVLVDAILVLLAGLALSQIGQGLAITTFVAQARSPERTVLS